MNAIIATSPLQMQEAQATTTSWIVAKLESAKRELSTAEQVYNSLEKNHIRTAPAVTQMKKARRRIGFYEKVKAALDAGYYIIPPFDIQLFAIRTDRFSPNEIDSRSWEKEQKPRLLPVGKGDYVDPTPGRSLYHTDKEKKADGTEREIKLYCNDNWSDVELPVRALKPQIIEETGRALEMKIFDALGIAPAYRAADPIIAGQIHRPDGKGALTFFIAWWLDESDL